MKNRWILVIDRYDGIVKKAVNMLAGAVSGYIKYVLPVKLIEEVTDDEIKNNKIITVGCVDTNRLLKLCSDKGNLTAPEAKESYSIFVGENLLNPDLQMIAIAGADDQGVLYGCMQFLNKYMGEVICRNGDMWSETFYQTLLDRPLPEFKTYDCPAIAHRALWTWGHVIYDYRKYFENMAKLRLNEVVIWNDIIPLNAKDVVDYAHSLGINVIWGFAWGWGVKCDKILETFDDAGRAALKESVLNTFKKDYMNSGCDGIYFQSFTELAVDNIGGVLIADLVTDLVNEISGELLALCPDLHIQFGLHASSVKTHLDIIAKVDKRVHIVWEDCGSFPYNYWVDKVSDFNETLDLTETLVKLRGNEEKFGAVFKGMAKLDWNIFEHFESSYILGEKTSQYISARRREKAPLWKSLQGSWLKYADLARRTVLTISKGNDPIVEALVEDGAFEEKIFLPVALYAEMLWNPETDTDTLLEQVAQYPITEFANI